VQRRKGRMVAACALRAVCVRVSGGTSCFIGTVCVRERGDMRANGTSDRGPTQEATPNPPTTAQ
jgi:hypothetical protein